MGVKEDGRIVVSYSELKTYRECPLKHKWEYHDRWAPTEEKPALARGHLWHWVMAAHYTAIRQAQKENRIPDAEEIFDTVKQGLFDAGGNQTEDQGLITWMYAGYLEAYGLDPDWEILAVEHKAEVPILEGMRESGYWLKVIIDLVIRDRFTGKIWIVDHKTGRDAEKDKDLDLDDQFGLYTAGVRALGKPVLGSIYNGARTQRNKAPMELDNRFKRTLMMRTDIELAAIMADALATARAAYAKHPPTYSPYSSPTSDCKWRCPFVDVHLMWRKGAGELRDLMHDFGMEQYR